MNAQARQVASALRAAADALERLPAGATVAIPTIDVFARNLEELIAVRKALGGLCTKHALPSWFFLRRDFDGTKVEINVARTVACKRVKVGEHVVPAQEAVPEHTEDIYEWQCPDSVLAENGEPSEAKP